MRLDNGKPVAFCDATGARLQMGDWWHAPGQELDLCGEGFEALTEEEQERHRWEAVDYPGDLGNELPVYRPQIRLQGGDHGRTVNAALAFRGANLKVPFEKIVGQFNLHMTGQRLGQIYDIFSEADPLWCAEHSIFLFSFLSL